MVSSPATTVAKYLASQPAERRKVISTVRGVIRRNLPKGYREVMNWGMISYEIPLTRYPDSYNGQPLMYVALAAQKNFYAIYLTCVYHDPKRAAWFREAFKAAGKKLDMGKSCLRFKRLDDLPLEVIGQVVASTSLEQRIAIHEASRRR
jgi:hypothetical protein